MRRRSIATSTSTQGSIFPNSGVLSCRGRALVAYHGASSRLATSIGKDRKGLASVLIYLTAIPLAFVWPKAAYGCYIFVAVMWLVPDPRIEKVTG